MNEMKLWDAVKQPPPEVLKKILGGRLSGMTDIKPQWRYEKATEQFGPCGFGWKYTVDKKWLEPGANEEVVAFADISLYVKIDDQWSEAIPGHGGSKFIAREKINTPDERLYTSDEAYKMAVTDALSVSFKQLGFGADVHMGRWDGSKYSLSETVDEGKVADWQIACKDAAEGTHEEFKKWWPSNKVKIKEACGDAGAAQVYAYFAAMLKGMPE